MSEAGEGREGTLLFLVLMSPAFSFKLGNSDETEVNSQISTAHPQKLRCASI